MAEVLVKVVLSAPVELVQITFMALLAYVPSGKAIEVFGVAVFVIYVVPPFKEYLTDAAFEASALTAIVFTLLIVVVEEGKETEVMIDSTHKALFVLLALNPSIMLFKVAVWVVPYNISFGIEATYL